MRVAPLRMCTMVLSPYNTNLVLFGSNGYVLPIAVNSYRFISRLLPVGTLLVVYYAQRCCEPPGHDFVCSY